MTKILSRLLILSMMVSCLSSCSKDDDDDLVVDRVTHITDLTGLWLATDNSNDWFLVTTANQQTSAIDFNSVGLYWAGMYTYYGVPRVHTEGGVTMIDNYSSNKLIIESFNSNKGTLTLYNPNYYGNQQFRRSVPGNVACIVNESEKGESFESLEIEVYAEGLGGELTLIYDAVLPGGTMTLHSAPFWLGGVQSTVKAVLTSGYTGKKYNATWTHLQPNKYYTLTY